MISEVATEVATSGAAKPGGEKVVGSRRDMRPTCCSTHALECSHVNDGAVVERQEGAIDDGQSAAGAASPAHLPAR